MDLQQIRYIIALAEEKHFQKAAKRTRVSQPTLSQQVKKLEQELGAALFERTSQGAYLTEAGKTFLPYAVHCLDWLQKGTQALRAQADKLAGTVRLAAIPTICPYLIPQLAAHLSRTAPEIKLEIYEETTSVLVDSIKNGKFELGLLALPIEENGLVNHSLGREPFLLAVPRSHALAKRKQVCFTQFKKEKLLILQEGHCFRDQALEYCEHFQAELNVKFQGSSLTSVMKMAEAEEGITLVPRMAVSTREYPELAFIPFKPPVPTRDVGMIWRLSAPLNRIHWHCIQGIGKILQAR